MTYASHAYIIILHHFLELSSTKQSLRSDESLWAMFKVYGKTIISFFVFFWSGHGTRGVIYSQPSVIGIAVV